MTLNEFEFIIIKCTMNEQDKSFSHFFSFTDLFFFFLLLYLV